MVIRVPAIVGNKARNVGATQWLEDLPTLVASLEHEWSITVGDPYDDATEAFVAGVTLDDGTPAVVKLLVPRSDNAARNEITVLGLTQGDGCVRMMWGDTQRGALCCSNGSVGP